MPFCTNFTRAPGGTKFPSIGLLLIPASHPKAKAECVNPEKDHTKNSEQNRLI
jgi:hypothetical protein